MRLRWKGVLIRCDAGLAARTYDQVVTRAPYRLPAPKPRADVPLAASDTYVAAWRSLRLRRFILLATIAACILFACLGGQRLLVLPFVAFAVAVVKLYLFACPRCRDLFFVDKPFRPLPVPDLFLSWYCPHCRLRRPRVARAVPTDRVG
jgi:hypothetical protein